MIDSKSIATRSLVEVTGLLLNDVARFQGSGRRVLVYEDADGRVGMWSGAGQLPDIGDEVEVKINGIGPALVVGYFIENGWVGVLVEMADPPEWMVRQNGNNRLPCIRRRAGLAAPGGFTAPAQPVRLRAASLPARAGDCPSWRGTRRGAARSCTVQHQRRDRRWNPSK